MRSLVMTVFVSSASALQIGLPAKRAVPRTSSITLLTADQTSLIQKTWASVGALGSETVGVLLFKNIFEAAPAASGLFAFGREPDFDPSGDLAANSALVKHASGVVDTVGTAVSLLDDLETLGPVLVDLGARHFTYSVEAVHYPIVGAAFLKTLEMGLGEAYTKDVAAAYTAMWGVVESTMLSADGAEPVTAATTSGEYAPAQEIY